MGGRVALELGFGHPDRLTAGPHDAALAWLRDRRWAPYLRWMRPELGLLQLAPRAVVERIMRALFPGADTSGAVGDRRVRAHLQDTAGPSRLLRSGAQHLSREPHGDDGFWSKLRMLAPQALFVWGSNDRLAPVVRQARRAKRSRRPSTSSSTAAICRR